MSDTRETEREREMRHVRDSSQSDISKLARSHLPVDSSVSTPWSSHQSVWKKIGILPLDSHNKQRECLSFYWLRFSAALDFECLCPVLPVPVDSVCLHIQHSSLSCAAPVMSDRSLSPLSIFSSLHYLLLLLFFVLASYLAPFFINWCWFLLGGF